MAPAPSNADSERAHPRLLYLSDPCSRDRSDKIRDSQRHDRPRAGTALPADRRGPRLD